MVLIDNKSKINLSFDFDLNSMEFDWKNMPLR